MLIHSNKKKKNFFSTSLFFFSPISNLSFLWFQKKKKIFFALFLLFFFFVLFWRILLLIYPNGSSVLTNYRRPLSIDLLLLLLFLPKIFSVICWQSWHRTEFIYKNWILFMMLLRLFFICFFFFLYNYQNENFLFLQINEYKLVVWPIFWLSSILKDSISCVRSTQDRSILESETIFWS